MTKNKPLIFSLKADKQTTGGLILSEKVDLQVNCCVYKPQYSSFKMFNFCQINQSFWYKTITGLYNRNKGLGLHTLLGE